MKKLYLFLLVVLIFGHSCIDKGQCVEDYLEADEWYISRTKMAGDNQEAKDAIYEDYLKKYREIDVKCDR